MNKNNNISLSSKNILPKTKDVNNELIKKDNINTKNDNNLNDNNKIDKKITVNLNAQNTRIKNNKNKNIHINMNLVNLPPQNQNIFSPFSSLFTQSHEKSLSILSSKNFNKKANFSSKDNGNKSIESSNNHISIIINEQKLIDSSFDGNIRIWNFHSAELLNKIKIGNVNFISINIYYNYIRIFPH